ncbi:MAG: hypothetical protein SWO11_05965 [Thermodesulfobacteriota bacterium]|nr:hypothetical protein [Thermodesulfobacteriota bacterium]
MEDGQNKSEGMIFSKFFNNKVSEPLESLIGGDASFNFIPLPYNRNRNLILLYGRAKPLPAILSRK